MSPRQREAYRKHPARAEQLLMPLAELKSTAEIIGSQLERFDGSGFPLGTAGKHIGLAARILALSSDYDSLQIGILEPLQFSRQDAMQQICQRSGHDYDPAVVNAFQDIYRDLAQDEIASGPSTTKSVKSRDLAAGMVLSRDMTSPTGLLLLTSGHVLDDAVIRKIRNFEHSLGAALSATVWVGPPVSET
jgi:hypothetical protein